MMIRQHCMLCLGEWDYDIREFDISNLAFVITHSIHDSTSSGLCHRCAEKMTDYFNVENNKRVQYVTQRCRDIEHYLQDLTIKVFTIRRDMDASKRNGETDSPTPQG